ncbi:MAG: Flp pilus assembly protein CpaB [Bacillota bacterium]
MDGVNKKIAIIAVVMALLTSLLIYVYLSGVNNEDPKAKMKTIFVAKEDIPAKVVIRQDMLMESKVPVDITLPMGISDINLIVGKMTRERIIKGEAILEERLFPEKKTNMAYVVPQGKRAVTIGVNEVSQVADFIIPGDKVDVIATFEEKEKDYGTRKVFYEKLTKVILQNVMVLGVGQNMEEVKKQQKELPTSVTLAVSLEEAEKLVLADESGTLRLALRPALDDSSAETNGIIRDDIIVPKGKLEQWK